MSDLSPYDFERITIGLMLVYPDAPKYVLPNLTHDKFLYSKEGRLDGARDHMRIWQAITYCYLQDKVAISIPVILAKMGEGKGNTDFFQYLHSLELAVSGYYRIKEFDVRTIMGFAELVDKSGVAYQAAVKSYNVAKIIQSPEEFAKAVTKDIGDVTEWLHNHVSSLSKIVTTGKPEGYKHISESVERAKFLADQVYSGNQVMFLPAGLPSLLVPSGKLIILMGESNSGKSVVTHQINLGTAIGLKRFGIPGCVAVNSLEEREEPFTLKLAAMLASVNLWEFQYGKDGISPLAKYRLDKALEYVATLPIYLDTTNILTVDAMDFRVTGLNASEFGPVHQMSVDYLERLAYADKDAENGEKALDRSINHCAAIVGTTGATVIVISQVTQGNSGNFKARIAGPDGTRGSRSSRFAADDIWEWWNPIEMKKAHIEFAIPDGMNGDQPWLLNPKKRYGPKIEPTPFGWEPEYQRIYDPQLNSAGNLATIVFNHPLPNFAEGFLPSIQEIEAGGF